MWLMNSYCYDYQFDCLARLLENIDEKLEQLLEIQMDKKINKIEKETKRVEKDLGNLKKDDKKRDKFVDAGKKAMKKK